MLAVEVGGFGAPLGAELVTLGTDCAPGGENIVGDFERRCRPAEGCAGAVDFFRAQRAAVSVLGALLGRRAVADDGTGGDQPWLRRVGLGFLDGR